jgi:putative polyhydroxyalkanoate system protein
VEKTMPNAITITVPHNLGVEAAKARVSDQLTKMQRDYVNMVAHSEVTWAGDVATVRVTALGQTVTAQVAVLNDLLRVDIQLPWLLAALSGTVQQIVSRNANEALRISHASKDDSSAARKTP